MNQEAPSPPAHRRWTPAEDALLHRLRILEHRPWPEVAQALNRSTQAVAAHYYQYKIAQSASIEDWDATMDAQIIDGRRRGLNSQQIATEMRIPAEAVQGRWYELKQLKRIPEDVLVVWRRKGEVQWSEKEDEKILRAWVDGKDQETIVDCLEFEGKYKCDVRERYRLLLREKGPIYGRLMGLDGKKPAATALDQALGEKKFAWMS